ncbi:SRPBCC family protein [Rhabdothermincola salaria]|uniref:SRPBCC family protein n=1 Tax=Rhabdothermincola salaria TaxID=2903142 RepID=UPI001E53F66F|nr:SRPBCC family protein [Rhabdothermincola salaria]MCD9625114.1 hypothetical protein [Rhabdothermincola salaria]
MLESDRTFPVEAEPGEVWSTLCRPERYRVVWPWLKEFDGTALAEGERWSCAVQPPLPYVVRFRLSLHTVVAGERVEAEVDGDIRGRARLTVAPAPHGTDLHLVSELEPATILLRGVLRAAPPIARFGHDWVLDTGAHQFRSRACSGR